MIKKRACVWKRSEVTAHMIIFAFFAVTSAQFSGLTAVPGDGPTALRSRVLSSLPATWLYSIDTTYALRVDPYNRMLEVGSTDSSFPQTPYGIFSGWYASNASASAPLTYAALFFNGGAACGQYRPERQGLVYLTCGATFAFTSAVQDPVCFYTARLAHPAVCGVDLRVGFENASASGTPTATPSASGTPTATPSGTPSPPLTRSGTPSPPLTRSGTTSPTRTRSGTFSPTCSRSGTISPSSTNTSASRSPTVTPSRTSTPSASRTPSRSATSTLSLTPGGLFAAPLRLGLTLLATPAGGGGGAGARVAAALLAGPAGQALRRDASRALTPLLLARAAPLPVSAVQVVITAVGGAPLAADSAANLRRRVAGEEAVSVALTASLYALALHGVQEDVAALLQNHTRVADAFATSVAQISAECGCGVAVAAAAGGGAGDAGSGAGGAELGPWAIAAAALGALAGCVVITFLVLCARLRRAGGGGVPALSGVLPPAGVPPPPGLDVRSPELHAWARQRGAPLAVGPPQEEGVELPWAPSRWAPTAPYLPNRPLLPGKLDGDPLPFGASV